MTKVVSVRGQRREELEGRPGFVYVGRRVAFTPWPESPFGNPYKVGQHGAARAVELFAGLLAEPPTSEALIAFPGTPADAQAYRRRILDGLPALAGKTLGCWCVDWPGTGEPSAPCHAVVLARLADATIGDSRAS